MLNDLRILQFIEFEKLTDVIGKKLRVTQHGHDFDVIPLPHPSGASPWHRMEPGKSLLGRALKLIVKHEAWPERSATELHRLREKFSPSSSF